MQTRFILSLKWQVKSLSFTVKVLLDGVCMQTRVMLSLKWQVKSL
jgi:hypothetical protein